VAFFEEIISFVSERLLPEVFELAAVGNDVAKRALTVVTAGGTTWPVIRWLRGAFEDSPALMARRCAGIALALIGLGKRPVKSFARSRRANRRRCNW